MDLAHALPCVLKHAVLDSSMLNCWRHAKGYKGKVTVHMLHSVMFVSFWAFGVAAINEHVSTLVTCTLIAVTPNQKDKNMTLCNIFIVTFCLERLVLSTRCRP